MLQRKRRRPAVSKSAKRKKDKNGDFQPEVRSKWNHNN
jgi:hypothetical protein